MEEKFTWIKEDTEQIPSYIGESDAGTTASFQIEESAQGNHVYSLGVSIPEYGLAIVHLNETATGLEEGRDEDVLRVAPFVSALETLEVPAEYVAGKDRLAELLAGVEHDRTSL